MAAGLLSRSTFDYVIVGAGAAGCVLAARLSEDPATRVLLIEAGGSDRGLATRIPLMTVAASASPRRNWSYTTETIPELNNRRQVWNQGRLIGGSSSINGMIYARGHPREYAAWQRDGCKGWSFDELLPYFKKIESCEPSDDIWHGNTGPVPICRSRLNSPVCTAFVEAVRTTGLPWVEDINAGVSEGFYRFYCNIHRGMRVSSARAYLNPVRRRRNLTVIGCALALRILMEGHRAKGVEVARGRDRDRYFAEREVILSAGALNSPALLLASGIGPAGHLEEIGIPVVADSPEVGENLQNHVACLMPYYCTAPVSAYRYLSPAAGARSVLEYLLLRRGPLAETFASIGGNLRSHPDLEFADTLIGFVPSLMQRASGSMLRWWDLLPKEHGCTLLVCLGRPHSRGRIKLRSRNLGDAPRIFPEFFCDPRDLSALVSAVELMARIMTADCIARYLDPRRGAASWSRTPQVIERIIRETAVSFSHPSGTCRMGADACAVVDPQLRVNGLVGLRVADNSIMPGPLNAFLHAPALMIGEKAAALIRGTAVVEERERIVAESSVTS